jgi:hypothetical protein
MLRPTQNQIPRPSYSNFVPKVVVSNWGQNTMDDHEQLAILKNNEYIKNLLQEIEAQKTQKIYKE